MAEYCRHRECQSHAAAELAWMSERLDRPALVLAAAAVLEKDLEVRCRVVARRGGAAAPLPEARESFDAAAPAPGSGPES